MNLRSDRFYAMNQYTRFNNRGGVFCAVGAEAISVEYEASSRHNLPQSSLIWYSFTDFIAVTIPPRKRRAIGQVQSKA
jgi:hypothetical protein